MNTRPLSDAVHNDLSNRFDQRCGVNDPNSNIDVYECDCPPADAPQGPGGIGKWIVVFYKCWEILKLIHTIKELKPNKKKICKQKIL